MTKISIIVPIYNGAQTIKRCFDSIAVQDYKNIEVIAINDGSTDDSGTICDKYAALDDRFVVLHITNAGVSNARNIGILQSRGELLTFIDVDDQVTPDYISSIVSTNADADISICGCTIIQETKEPKRESLSTDLDLTEQGKINSLLNNHLVRPVWGKLFRKNIIIEKAIAFDSSVRLGEDTLFVLNYLKHTKSLNIVENNKYFYNRDNFTINKFRNSPNDFIEIYLKLNSLTIDLKSSGYSTSTLENSNYKSLANNLFLMLYLSKKYTYNERKLIYLQFIKVNPNVRLSNFGISSLLLFSLYKIILKTNSFLMTDLFLKIYYSLIKWKNNKN